MEDPSFIQRLSIHRRAWLLTALVVVFCGYLTDQRMRGLEVAHVKAPEIHADLSSSSVPENEPPSEIEPLSKPAPMGRVEARYLRQVRQTHRLYHPIIKRAARRYEVDPALVKAIIMAESAYNPRAVSNSGALGLMQLMPSTARSLGVADSFNPEHNITGGVRYFRQLLNTVDEDPSLALAAYNAGPAKVLRYNGMPPYKVTRRYVQKVLAYYRCYQHLSQEEQLSGQV
jgi:soluble lytic murein transglycosylase-like protein